MTDTPAELDYQALDAALDAADDAYLAEGDDNLAFKKAVLTAIKTYLAAEETELPAVKVLEWSAESPYHVARVLGIGGLHYSIERVDAAVTYFELKGMFVWPVRKFPTIDEAKAAAQANFESRIRSALIGGADGK